MMKIPESLLNQIQDKADILSIVGKYVRLEKRGSRYWACCPFHGEKTPSFTVTPEKNMYYCFGCHKGGGVFRFVMDMENLSFMEAVKIVAKDAGIPLNLDYNPEDFSRRESLQELYNRVAGSFHYLLLNAPEATAAREYTASRKISPENQSTFNLGYVPGQRGWLLNFLEKKNYTREFLAESGLFSTKTGDLNPYFFDRLMFPIFNLHGDVIAFGGRMLRDGQPKYLNSPETTIFHKSASLYGLYQAKEAIRKEKCFYLVEGYLDVLALHQGGIKNVVAPLGTALTPQQVKILGRYAEKGILLFDGDEAGMKATIKGIELLERGGLESEVVALEEKSDPADILEKDGPSRLIKLLKCSINSFDYLLKKASLKFDKGTPAGKEKIFQFLSGYLDSIESRVKRDGYLTQLADELNVNVSSLFKDFQKRKGLNDHKVQGNPIQRHEEIKISDELFLLLAVTAKREYFTDLRKYITLDLLEDHYAKDLYIALEEDFRKDKKSLETLLENVENELLKALIREKQTSGEFAINTERIIFDGIYRIKLRSITKRREQIAALLKKYEINEPWKMKDLLVEKMVLDREYEELRILKDVRNRE